jgi:cephalosporin hydroxylase
MNDEQKFSENRALQIQKQKGSLEMLELSKLWMQESIKTNYSYNFEWLGRPIIQYPQDMIGVQQLLWSIKPDLIIETGIARGGSLIYYASILELIAQCGGPENGSIVGIDIDIRKHNKHAILNHPMSKRIQLIEGSSTDNSILEKLSMIVKNKQTILVCLDSNHTHEHVLQELRAYSPFVSKGSYLIVFDTIVQSLPEELVKERPWGEGNNPMTAVKTFLTEQMDNDALNKFVVDTDIEGTLMLTVAPGGYLRRV